MTKKVHTSTEKNTLIPGVCMGILGIFVLFIALFLVYFSIRYSYYSPIQYNSPVILIKDNTAANLAVAAAILLLIPILNRLFDRLGNRQRRIGYLFLFLCCLLYTVMCLIWVDALPYYPSGDQLNATAAAHYHLEGNFVMLKNSGYLGKFPYQKGLTLLYEVLFTVFGHFCYGTAARFHIFFGVITLITGYLFVEETSFHSICKILYCPLFLLCVPFLILTPYTYGDLPSICFCTVLFWALLRYTRTGNNLYVILCCFMSALSLMVRLHTWIALIAVIIGLFLVACQKKSIAPLLAGVLILTGTYGTTKAIDYSYAARSGYPITKGAPMILTLAMGMQNNDGGPGAYNNYQTSTLGSVDFDREAASAIARENLKENLTSFIQNPSYGYWFFKTKLSMQWTEPSFETLLSTHSFKEGTTLPDWIWEIYYGKYHNPLLCFADRYQSVVYLGFLFYVPVFWKKRRENAALYIPLITIVGGFLFSIIWESQCRYVLPYYMYMLLYVPDGLYFVSNQIKTHLHLKALFCKIALFKQNKV